MSTKFRVHKNSNYTVMSNYHLRDTNLSLKAAGLMSKMLSLPDDWDYSINGLAAICKEGVKAIRSALKELEENGYLVRTRVNGEGGKYTYNYDIYECPIEVEKESPYDQNGYAVPYDQNGYAVNGTQINTNKQNTNIYNNNNNNNIINSESKSPEEDVVVDMIKKRKIKINKKDAAAILKAANNDLAKVEKALDVLLAQKNKINNVPGWIISAISENYGQSEMKPAGMKNKFHNFIERDNDYDALQNKLLGYDVKQIEEYKNDYDELEKRLLS